MSRENQVTGRSPADPMFVLRKGDDMVARVGRVLSLTPLLHSATKIDILHVT